MRQPPQRRLQSSKTVLKTLDLFGLGATHKSDESLRKESQPSVKEFKEFNTMQVNTPQTPQQQAQRRALRHRAEKQPSFSITKPIERQLRQQTQPDA